MNENINWLFFTIAIFFLGYVFYYKRIRYKADSSNKSLIRKDHYEIETVPTTHVIHFSIDDFINAFYDLTINQESYSSIFDNELFAWLKLCHDKYGIKISCFVFFQSKGFSLKQCTDRYRQEFCDNADWLRFGFHARNSRSRYMSKDLSLVDDYLETIPELVRIVGSASIDHIIRIHGFSGGREAILKINRCTSEGIYGLYTSDDLRRNYWLDYSQNQYIYNHDYYYEPDAKIVLVSSDFRLEFVSSISEKMKELSTDAWNNQLEILEIFTHEWTFTDEIKHKINEICEYPLSNLLGDDYRFDFIDSYVDFNRNGNKN